MVRRVQKAIYHGHGTGWLLDCTSVEARSRNIVPKIEQASDPPVETSPVNFSFKKPQLPIQNSINNNIQESSFPFKYPTFSE